MPEYPPLVQKVGIVGRDPETKSTPKGDLVNFSLAVPKQYGPGEDNTEWVNVTVWNDELQPNVLEQVYKGAKVAVEGNLKVLESEGLTYRDFDAFRVGLVAWVPKGGASKAAGKSRVDPGGRAELLRA